ncbi:MAG: UxaA family hydrolase [Phoenicibacter congonensis]|uniref:UxaA family hydrolase n=1 Tax=Phoenicibacter congonensis TaxID=1944646 RepID=A0AA43RI03_9ACTN|nr:UxaA family hydrolase [Phoenicibacter congonensis]
MKTFIHNEKDDVAVVLEETPEIPRFHKVALKDIAEGEDVFEYGEVIGHASKAIAKGELVHIHNLATNRW